MKKLTGAILAAALLASVACDRMLTQARKTVYVPWEEGLTLVYEDPTLPPAERFSQRQQRRVSASKETPQGRRVTITYTTLKSNQSFDFSSRDGSWVMMLGETPLLAMLPEGFPDRVDHWEEKERGFRFRVIGRGALQNSPLSLPSDYDRVGIWVEMERAQGRKVRIFYLPGIGEAESQMLMEDGKWVMVNHLVSRGFTDEPAAKTDAKNP